MWATAMLRAHDGLVFIPVSRVLLALVPLSFSVNDALAQKLPPTTRTVYKCEVNGKIVYSDDPCLGAKKLEIEPTRGMNKATGREQVGRDVQLEHNKEAMQEVFRPFHGMDGKQLDKFERRMKLVPAARTECNRLDQSIPEQEALEQRAGAQERPGVQKQLLALRMRARDLGC